MDIEAPRDFELIQIAGEFIDSDRCDYAVIAIQTAVEIYVEQRLVGLFDWRNLGPLGDVILEQLVPPPYNFRSDRLKALWKSLTRDEIQTHEWWGDYVEHVKCRHEVVHAGKHVTREEAERSLLAALALMDHVHRVWIETGVWLGRLREVGTEGRADPDPY